MKKRHLVKLVTIIKDSLAAHRMADWDDKMDIGDLTGHLAFGLIAFSFVVKDIFWLRVMSITASAFSIFYNYFIPAEPMIIAIGWNFIFITVNLYHIAVIVYEHVSCRIFENN